MFGEMSSIIRELEMVQDRLSSLTNDAAAEKLALMNRREQLRTRAARLADDVDAGCSTDQLLRQLAGLRRRRDVLNRQRHARPAGPMSAHGTQVEDRIRRIRDLLADRGISVR